MHEKKDCFAYCNEKVCVALNVINCKDCKFYKTHEQIEYERKQTDARMLKKSKINNEKTII